MDRVNVSQAPLFTFQNRKDAGKKLAEQLEKENLKNAIVIGLPRGGVPVAFEVATRLHLPLDVLVARKIGAPENPEFGIGAITEGNTVWLDNNSISALGVLPESLNLTISKEEEEVRLRIQKYRNNRPLMDLRQKTIILIDDGLATGSTAMAAIKYIRSQEAAKIILAVPVCAESNIVSETQAADQIVCCLKPSRFFSVSLWYQDFTPTTDEEVVQILNQRVPIEKTAA